MSEQTRRCNKCNKTRDREEFTRSQWRKKQTATCLKCQNVTIKAQKKQQKKQNPETNNQNDECWVYKHKDGYWRETKLVVQTEQYMVIKLTRTDEEIALQLPEDSELVQENWGLVDTKHTKDDNENKEQTMDEQGTVQTPQNVITQTNLERINSERTNSSNNDPSNDTNLIDINSEDRNNDNPITNPSMSQSAKRFKLYIDIKADVRSKFPDANDEEIKQFATNEYNQIMKSQQDYSKMIYNESILTKFEGKYPTNENEFWIYLTTMNRFQSEYSTIPESRLITAIVQSCTETQRDAWGLWKLEQERAFRASEHTSREIEQYKEQLNTFTAFESYLMKKLRLSPSAQYFHQQIGYIRMGYNENPEDAHERIQSYLNQIRIVIDKFNANRTVYQQIPHFTEREILNLYERVFIYRNNDKLWGNTGKLNRKVKIHLNKWWIHNRPTVTLETFITAIKSCHISILPSEMENDEEHWKKFKSNLTIFTLKSYMQISGNKRKREDNNTGKGPKPKKFKYSERPPCKFGMKCKLLPKGNCSFRHTKLEIQKKLNNKHTKNVSTTRTSNKDYNSRRKGNYTTSKRRHDPRSGGRAITTQQTRTPPCKYGNNCYQLKEGTCRFYHPKPITCHNCGKTGHKKAQCRLPTIKQEKPPPSKYNPYAQPNPHQPNPHMLTLNIDGKKYIQQTTTQYVPINTTNNTKNPNMYQAIPITQPIVQPMVQPNTFLPLQQPKNIDKQQWKQVKREAQKLTNQIQDIAYNNRYAPIANQWQFQTPRT